MGETERARYEYELNEPPLWESADPDPSTLAGDAEAFMSAMAAHRGR
jgi:hypothetical protein